MTQFQVVRASVSPLAYGLFPLMMLAPRGGFSGGPRGYAEVTLGILCPEENREACLPCPEVGDRTNLPFPLDMLRGDSVTCIYHGKVVLCHVCVVWGTHDQVGSRSPVLVPGLRLADSSPPSCSHPLGSG